MYLTQRALISSSKYINIIFQGRAGDKGQKGELGSPGYDVFSAVKVSIMINDTILTLHLAIFEFNKLSTPIIEAYYTTVH